MSQRHRLQRLPLAPLAWAAGLIPLVTMHLCYGLSASEGLVAWCLPWFEGCTSISRASRSGSAYFVFKGAMLPGAVFIFLFWYANRYWLGLSAERPRCWWWLGMLAALPLTLYTVALGHMGETLYLLRRIGVVGFFGLTFLAQVGLSQSLWRHARPVLGQRLLLLSGFTLLVGLVSVFINGLWPQWHDRMEDGFEWSLAVLLNLHTLIVAAAWQRSNFALYFSQDKGG